jgi:hypothetical protein
MRTRSNPRLPSGAEIERYGAMAGGLFATATVNNTLAGPILHPIVAKVFPTILGSPRLQRAANAVTTWLSAMAVGIGVRVVDRRIGDLAEDGGKVLALGVAGTALVPTWNIGVSGPALPFNLGLGQPAIAAAPSQGALPSGQPTVSTPVTTVGGVAPISL